MIKVYSFEGKNEEECRMKCYDELDVYDNEIITKEYEEEDLYKMDVIKKSEVEDFINSYLKEVTEQMNIPTRISIMEDEGIYNVKLNSKKNAILIGKDGRTLSSLQVLLRQTIRNMCHINIKVNLDVSNYKSRQDKNFEYEVKQIINEVMKTKVDTTLDPMNSYKRRIVHTIASNYYNIETESIGEEPNRQTVIKYVEK